MNTTLPNEDMFADFYQVGGYRNIVGVGVGDWNTSKKVYPNSEYSNYVPMGQVLDEVSSRIRRDEIYNQGLSEAEKRNNMSVTEFKIRQQVLNEGLGGGRVDNQYAIKEKDLELAGEELRDDRGKKFKTGVKKFDKGQTSIPKVEAKKLSKAVQNSTQPVKETNRGKTESNKNNLKILAIVLGVSVVGYVAYKKFK